MEEFISRFFEHLVGRIHGPMSFRMIIQPLMAIFFATRDGIKDARVGRVPYFWSLINSPEHRRDLLRSGWKSVGKVFVIALILDAIYQLKVLRTFYPGEALVVAFFLAVVPYMLLRGPANRLVGRKGTGEHEA
jgi:hypothetical protein